MYRGIVLLSVTLVLSGCGGSFLFEKPGIDFKAPGACAVQHDSNQDKIYDDRSEIRYDAQGRRIEVARDETNDGVVELRIRFAFDSQGRLASQRTLSADGSTLEIITYRYDSAGRLLEESVDDGGNGTTDLLTRHEYAPDGRLDVRRTYRGDTARAESIERVTLDADGHELQVEMDSNNDGRTDLVQQNHFDTEGRETRWEVVNQATGDIDRVTTLSYDKRGNRIEKQRLDKSGKLLRQTRYYYDKYGNRYGEIEKDLTDGSEIRTFYDYSCWRK